MALLWVQAMAWHDGSGLKHDEAQPISVRHAGFKGYVGSGDDWQYGSEPEGDDKDKFDENLYEDTTPEPTAHEQRHYDKHGEYPDSHYERHDKAYAKAVADKAKAAVKLTTDDAADPSGRKWAKRGAIWWQSPTA